MKTQPKAKTVAGREPLLRIYQRRFIGEVFQGSGDQGPVEAAFALIGRDLDHHDVESSIDGYDFTLGDQVFEIEVKRDLTPALREKLAKQNGEDDRDW